MRPILLLPLLIIFSCSEEKKSHCNYITDYYQIIFKANLEFELENYERAFNLYQDAFSSCEAKNTMGVRELDKFTETSAILNKFDITYAFAKKQIQNGVELTSFQNNSNFEEFLDSDDGKKIVLEYDLLRTEYLANANLKLRDELVSMHYADQMYRGGNGNADWTKQDSIDKLHENRLIEIFETIGYPTDKMVGPHSMNYPVDLGLLLLHTQDSIRMNYFVPKIKEFVKNGSASPHTLGNIIDQFYLYNDKPQIYGTYTTQNGGYATMIEDLEKVDSNRISIGLPPLELKEKIDSLNRVKYNLNF